MKKLIAALMLLCLLSGCGAQSAEPPTAPPEEISPVCTDWSKLTPYEPVAPVYTLHAAYSGGKDLPARSDYGTLLPYIGKYSSMEQYVIEALPLYGLVTANGELVTDPVYARISFYDDFLLLYRGDPDGVSGGDSFAGGTFSRTLAAPDGSWVQELTDSYFVGSGHGLALTAARSGSLDLWNTDGEIVRHFDGALFTPYLGEDFVWNTEGGPYLDWTDDKVGYAVSYRYSSANGEPVRFYLDFTTGEVLSSPPDGCGAEIDYTALEDDTPGPPLVEGCRYLDPITDAVMGETHFYGYYRVDETAQALPGLFDREGKLLIEDCGDLLRFDLGAPIVRDGLCSTIEDDCFCFRSLSDGSLRFRCLMKTNSD